MKKYIATVAVSLLLAVMPAMAEDKLNNIGGVATDVENEKTIRQLYANFADAWNRHDAAALADNWTIDGDLLEPDGTLVKGRNAIVKLLMAQHTGVFKDTTLALTISDVWFVSGDVALVDGNYQVTGAQAPDGTTLPSRTGHLTAILLNENGRWSIAASRLMIPTALPYKLP